MVRDDVMKDNITTTTSFYEALHGKPPDIAVSGGQDKRNL